MVKDEFCFNFEELVVKLLKIVVFLICFEFLERKNYNKRTIVTITLIAQMLLILIWHMRKLIAFLNMKMLKFQFMILLWIKGMLLFISINLFFRKEN